MQTEEFKSADIGSDFEDWENISASELILEGMDDPFIQKWRQVEKEYASNSELKEFKSYRLRTMIFKTNDDLRQELLAIQLMKRFKQVFAEANLSIYLRPYEIFIASANSGMVEFLPDTISLDVLKKKFPKGRGWTLKDFFERYYAHNFEEAQKNFVESLAGYSLFCYVLNVKDRHNGNIMLDYKGHIIHIDFGFMLQSSPGGINFEGAPFKLTQEYVEIMGGVDSEIFAYFKSLLIKGFFEIRRHIDDMLSIIQIMMQRKARLTFRVSNAVLREAGHSVPGDEGEDQHPLQHRCQ